MVMRRYVRITSLRHCLIRRCLEKSDHTGTVPLRHRIFFGTATNEKRLAKKTVTTAQCNTERVSIPVRSENNVREKRVEEQLAYSDSRCFE